MRSAKEQEFFPYDSRTTCYILVYKNADTEHIQHNKTDLAKAHKAPCPSPTPGVH